MSTEARTRIDSHRLMQRESNSLHEVRIDSAREHIRAQKKKEGKKWKQRTVIHVGIFVVVFIFAVGVSVLSILFLVRPDSPLTQLIAAGLFSLVFTGSFVGLRMFVLHHLINDYTNKEEDPGIEHHLVKSITYSIVALVLAVLVIGIILDILSTNIISSA